MRPTRSHASDRLSIDSTGPVLWHTATMRSVHWPGLRQVSAAAAVCLILAACGGGGSSHQSSAKPTASATASATAAAEPTSGPAAVAAITANWKTVFNGKAPLPSRLALVQDGSQVAAFVEAQATFVEAKAILDPASPLTYQLNKTLEDISGAARSTRELADFLQRNPSAVIRGRAASQDGR